MKDWKDERGSALIFTLLTMVGVVLYGMAILYLARNETLMARYQYRHTAAFYLAESGLQLAEARLEENPTYRGDIALPWEEGGHTKVRIREEGELLWVTSQGEREGVRCTLTACLRVVDHTPLYKTWGNIITKEIILRDDPADGPGLPLVEGEIICHGEGASDYFFPKLLPPALYQRELEGQNLTLGQLAGKRDLAGIIYVDGDVVLTDQEESIGGKAVLLVEGRLRIAGDAAIEGDFVLMAKEGIHLSGRTRMQGLIYTPGNFYYSGEGEITGIVWAGGKSTLAGEVIVKEYDGKKEVLLVDLPPVLVIREMWQKK